MNFEELVAYAKENECSDIHITVGTALAVRRFGELQILEPAPSAEESRDMIFSFLAEDQVRQARTWTLVVCFETEHVSERIFIIREIILRQVSVCCRIRFLLLKNWAFLLS